MPDVLFPIPGQLAMAGAVQGLLATGKARLFQSTLGEPTQATTRAELVANEATFSGYPAGGYEVTGFTNPMPDPTSGAILISPSIIVQLMLASPIVGNVIGGFWYEVGTTVFTIGVYPSPQPLSDVGDNIPFLIRLKLFSNPVL